VGATARGKGFMSYVTAMTRLRRALIPMLVNRQTVGPVQSLFARIFGASPRSVTSGFRPGTIIGSKNR